MLRHIVWKEMREALRDGRLRWSGLIVAALLAISLLAGWRQMADASAMRLAGSSETRRQWLDQGSKNPHAAAHYGVYAFQPTTPLSFVDPGINDFTGTVALLEAHKQNAFRYRVAQDSTVLERFGALSPAMILQQLVPLLIILFAFGAIAGERDEGTLRQLLSLGVRQSTIIWGKALGVAATLGILLVPAILVGAVAVAVGGHTELFDRHAMQDLWARAWVLAACYLAYFAVFLCLALAVSALARSARAALTILLGIWILNGILVPRAGAELGRELFPSMSAFEFARQVEIGKSHGIKPFDATSPEHIAFVSGLLEKYHVARVEDLPLNFLGLALQADEEHNFTVYDHLFGQVWGAFASQDRLQQQLSFLSPYLAVRSISSAIAGTDFAANRDFAASAEAYRRQVGRAMNDAIARGAAGKSVYAADWQLTAGPELWSRIPAFDYDPPPLASALSRQVVAALVLALWLLGGVLALHLAGRMPRVDT